jgi:hypothetical protein
VIRIILGVIVGFIVWSVIWLGSNFFLVWISPGWWGRSLAGMDAAVQTKTAFTVDTAILVIALCRSFICSLISGYIAALIARGNTKSTLALGILLFVFGCLVQWYYLDVAPIWYSILFLLLLIPLTILGGKLRKAKMA